jgi:RNA polymerase sigma factor FliA
MRLTVNELTAYEIVESLSDDELIKKYATLVKRIAHHLIGRLPNNIQVDDLIQAGMIGLLDAARNYDATKGASFTTYAGIRIRGMMLDEVRRNDWVPRSVYRNSRRITEAMREIENELGRDARDVEVAENLDVSISAYHQMLLDNNAGTLFGYEDLGVEEKGLVDGLAVHLNEPHKELLEEDLKDVIADCIASIPEREQLVLSLYYDEELNLKEIGEILNVSESRVCQIHSQATLRLRGKLADY